ncbi:ImmA/IrrE family metallo-endopeptidase [Lactobacillus crispatus]|uniref:Repressor n=1 Tax=Lactobacillus crispatus TaxID=47770 RepID=A0AAW4DLT7_9LACO|nr:ImmA/IrrE family metallo-endopeptidase [Lactobacillus crispatus]MBI1708271.1 repressor [Lactobacillus crispatus]
MITSIEDMSLETRQNYDKLMQYLMNYAMFDCHIGVEFTNKLPSYAPSVSYNKPGKLIIMNSSWPYPTQIPFLLAHEICHVLNEEKSYFNLNDRTKNSGEAQANISAIKLLQRYCIENEFHFSSIYQFARSFAIPKECYYLLADIA